MVQKSALGWLTRAPILSPGSRGLLVRRGFKGKLSVTPR